MIRLNIVVTLVFLLFSLTTFGQQDDDSIVEPAPVEPVLLDDAQPESTDEEVMYQVFAAELLGSEGDLQGAVGKYLEAAMNSDDPDISMRATRVAFAAQAWLQASMAADRWALLDPGSLAARESAALATLATADYVGAEHQLREYLLLNPDKDAAWATVSSLLARSSSPEKAIKVLDALLREQGESESSAGYYGQSQLAVRLEDFERALQLAQKAADLSPDEVEYQAWAGRLALTQGKLEVGTEYMKRAWEAQPDDHDLTLAYADVLARSGQADHARKLTAEMKQTPDVMLTRILFELSAADPEAASALYEQFKLMDFDNAHAKAFYLAQAAEAFDLIQEAIDFYAEIGEGPLFLQATARRAELMSMQGNMEGAIDTLAILRLDSDPLVVEQSWLIQARLFQQLGDFEGAYQSLGHALLQFENSIPLRYAHALLAAQLEHIDVAENDLRLILAEQPEHAAALNALGYTLADKTDRYAEAEELIQRAYALQPDDASITDSMGWVAFRQGRLAEAEEYLVMAWAMDSNPEIAAHLGEVLWVQGKKEQAREVWRLGLDVDEANEPLNETILRLDDGL